MGNSCTRPVESQVVQSQRRRGRWSNPDQGVSVDLDELIAAPSPPPVHTKATPDRRKKKRSKSRKTRRTKRGTRREEDENDAEPEAIDLDAAIAGDVDLSTLKKDRKKKKEKEKEEKKKAKQKYSKKRRMMDRIRGKRKDDQETVELEQDEEEDATYNSYEDPGFLTAVPIELEHFDSDLILGSPINSPSVIHARWGEPVEDPEEVNVCTEYKPNPFKLGFCVNCQKQHDVNSQGQVEAQKNYKKITLPAVAKTAANAELNPAAVENARPRERESDVDLAALLKQRRDIILKLRNLDMEKQKRKEAEAAVAAMRSTYDNRHTMCLSDSGGNATLAHLRRMSATTSGPQSYRIPRGVSMTLSPKPLRGISKSISVGSRLVEEDEPAANDWC